MLDIIPMLLAVISVILLVYATLTRKRWLEAKALLADTMIRFESVQQQNKKSDGSIQANKEQSDKLKAQFQKAEKQLDESRQKLNEKSLEAIRVKTEADELLKKSERSREHLLEQVQVLTQQLSEAVKDKKAAMDELNKAQRDIEIRAQQAAEGNRQQNSEVQAQLQSMRREKQALQTQFEKLKSESGLVKPEELKRWQLKVARLEQLYASMKGLREMAEERNQNWETALRLFAAHVLNQPADSDTGIGLLVGEALEKIGATLVIDDELPVTTAPVAPAATADVSGVPSPS
jgi:chromosome segregation ATPase